MYSIPNEIRCIVVARRLNGVVQPDTATVIGLPSQITYDVTALNPDAFVFFRQSVRPEGRPVSPMGMAVNIEAAKNRSICTFEILDTEERLFVRESIVFQDCQ